MEDGCVRYPGSSFTIGDKLLERDRSRNLEILLIQPWTGTRERETERELRNRLLLPRANALRNAHNRQPFLGCSKPLFKVRLSAKPLMWKWYLLSSRYHSFSQERFCIGPRFETRKWPLPCGLSQGCAVKNGLINYCSKKRHWGLTATGGERTWVGSERCPLSNSPFTPAFSN